MSEMTSVTTGEKLDPKKVSMVDRLENEEFWVDTNGYQYRILDLSDNHLVNILKMLMREADAIHNNFCTSALVESKEGILEISGQGVEMQEISAEDPWEWLQEQPITKLLIAEALKRGLLCDAIGRGLLCDAIKRSDFMTTNDHFDAVYGKFVQKLGGLHDGLRDTREFMRSSLEELRKELITDEAVKAAQRLQGKIKILRDTNEVLSSTNSVIYEQLTEARKTIEELRRRFNLSVDQFDAMCITKDGWKEKCIAAEEKSAELQKRYDSVCSRSQAEQEGAEPPEAANIAEATTDDLKHRIKSLITVLGQVTAKRTEARKELCAANLKLTLVKDLIGDYANYLPCAIVAELKRNLILD